MPLAEQSLLSELIATQDQPDGATVSAAEIDDYLRQIKGFLIRFLAQAHNDDGTLKDDVSALNFTDISGKVKTDQIESEAVDAVHLADDAVIERTIADNAVTEDKIKDGSVSADKLAANAVTNDKILDATISADKLAGSIPYSKLASSTGTNIVDNTITAAKHACPTGASLTIPNLIAVMDAAANSKIAQIGGVLTATLNTAGALPILEFAFAAATDTAGGFAIVTQSGTPSAVNLVSGWQHRKGWVATRDADLITIGSTGAGDLDLVNITRAGTYLALFMTAAYGTCASGGNAFFKSQLCNSAGTVLGTSTSARLVTAALETTLWTFGVAQFNIASGGDSVHFESIVADAGGTWYEGVCAAPTAGYSTSGIMLIIPLL